MEKHFTEEQVEDILLGIVQLDDMVYHESRPEEPRQANWTRYTEAGVLTSNRGLVLDMSDGSQYQITIVKSR